MRACCIVGAGYSHAAGLPLAKDLLDIDCHISSSEAKDRFQAVWTNFDDWRMHNPGKGPEEYLGYLYGMGAVIGQPHFRWAVELVMAVLATPLASDRRAANPRYISRITNPSWCLAHKDLWQLLLEATSSLSVVTTNYDLLVERSLRHSPMRRVFGPGCFYGGLARPQMLRGVALPFSVRRALRVIEMNGLVPVYKLHGSLNWCLRRGSLEMFQDARAAFRRGGEAAVVPPTTEKAVPDWLKPVWIEAEERLSEAGCWVVCGYSLPQYDSAIRTLLKRAATRTVQTIVLLDPNSTQLASSYADVAPKAMIKCARGLPKGIDDLRRMIQTA